MTVVAADDEAATFSLELFPEIKTFLTPVLLWCHKS